MDDNDGETSLKIDGNDVEGRKATTQEKLDNADWNSTKDPLDERKVTIKRRRYKISRNNCSVKKGNGSSSAGSGATSSFGNRRTNKVVNLTARRSFRRAGKFLPFQYSGLTKKEKERVKTVKEKYSNSENAGIHKSKTSLTPNTDEIYKCPFCLTNVSGGHKLFAIHLQSHRPTLPSYEEWERKCELEQGPNLTQNNPDRSFDNLLPAQDPRGRKVQTVIIKLRKSRGERSSERVPCPTCGKTFASNVTLKEHIRLHTGETPYKCSCCSKGFASIGNFHDHVRRRKGIRPHKCSVCFRSFSTRGEVSQHMWTHTAKQILQCPYCPKRFNRPKELAKHKKRHD